MTFEGAVQYLLGLGHETLTMKLGLRNTELLLDSFGNPQNAYPSVQIAGTNGKGSTAVFLESICVAAGIKCGLYTSPHLVSMTERIRFSGTDIAPQDFADFVSVVREASEALLKEKKIEAPPTFFEQLTVSALIAFRIGEVELAILETGLGGRLDSTTAANARTAAITQIAMDHEEYLGHTLESIASEKAAIIRPGVEAVIARQEPEAMAVLLKRCEETGVVPILADSIKGYENVRLGLRGRHQIDNAAVAIRLAESLRIPRSAIVTGLENARHPGRLESISHKPEILLDGAHNPAGCRSLRAYLDEFAPRPLTLVFGAMRDKQLEQIGEILFPVADVLILTPVANPRSAPVETLRPIASRFARGVVIETESSAEALQVALERTPSEGLICIAGSLYLIGEVRPSILKMNGPT